MYPRSCMPMERAKRIVIVSTSQIGKIVKAFLCCQTFRFLQNVPCIPSTKDKTVGTIVCDRICCDHVAAGDTISAGWCPIASDK